MKNIREILVIEKRSILIHEHTFKDIRKSKKDNEVIQPVDITIASIELERKKYLNVIPPCQKEKDRERAYFLPWKDNTGYYLDLPVDNPQASLFFTDGLSGCCVGVQQLSGMIRVCHYNIKGELFSREDFERYNQQNSIRHWLLPQKYQGQIGEMNACYYPSTCLSANPIKWCYFWGEYHSDGWQFYYQVPGDAISSFNYKT